MDREQSLAFVSFTGGSFWCLLQISVKWKHFTSCMKINSRKNWKDSMEYYRVQRLYCDYAPFVHPRTLDGQNVTMCSLIIPCYSLLSSQIRHCTTQLLLWEERRVFWISDELEWLDKEPAFTLLMWPVLFCHIVQSSVNPLWKWRYR